MDKGRELEKKIASQLNDAKISEKARFCAKLVVSLGRYVGAPGELLTLPGVFFHSKLGKPNGR